MPTKPCLQNFWTCLKSPPPMSRTFCPTIQPVYSQFFAIDGTSSHERHHSPNMRDLRERIRSHIKGNRGDNPNVRALVHRIEQKLHHMHQPPSVTSSSDSARERILRHAQSVHRKSFVCQALFNRNRQSKANTSGEPQYAHHL